jgi:hypothetical protein
MRTSKLEIRKEKNIAFYKAMVFFTLRYDTETSVQRNEYIRIAETAKESLWDEAE